VFTVEVFGFKKKDVVVFSELVKSLSEVRWAFDAHLALDGLAGRVKTSVIVKSEAKMCEIDVAVDVDS